MSDCVGIVIRGSGEFITEQYRRSLMSVRGRKAWLVEAKSIAFDTSEFFVARLIVLFATA